VKPVVFGLSGPALTPPERAFFRAAEPVGFILFKRNVETRAQLGALTDSLRDLTGRGDLPVLIDQEGGRVARMGPPEWPAFPAGPVFAAAYRAAPMTAIRAAAVNGQALGTMLADVGITVNCAPLLDVAGPDTTDAVACRAFGGEPMQVAALGRAMLDGMAAGGVVGVVKHLPGHGRATADSHHHLPRVTADAGALEADLEPFRALAARAAMGMTAHIVFDAWDAERPATLSPVVVRDVIRGRIGFDGFLFSDDIDMKALSGTPADKAAGAVAAGCDAVLDCWARMEEMAAIADRLDAMAPASAERLARAMGTLGPGQGDLGELTARRDALLASAHGDKPV